MKLATGVLVLVYDPKKISQPQQSKQKVKHHQISVLVIDSQQVPS